MKFFSLDKLEEATNHLATLDSKWVLIPLVLAANGVDESELTNIQAPGQAGSSQFLSKYFSGSLIGLPQRTLRPGFTDVSNKAGDLVAAQNVNLWGSAYSQVGYSRMRERGELSGTGSEFRIEDPFQAAWDEHLGSLDFTNLLIWLYGFNGFDEDISDWDALFVDFQETHLGPGGRFPALYESHFSISESAVWPAESITDVRPDNEDYIERLIPSGKLSGPAGEASDAVSLIDSELMARQQIVLQGPPGVGKTFSALRFIDWKSNGAREKCRLTTHLKDLSGQNATPEDLAAQVQAANCDVLWEIVQFHPSYTYEDFVRGVEAVPTPNGVTFEARNKVLGWLAATASHLNAVKPGFPVILVVDEINRADISKVLGELIFGLEYRDEPVLTPYEIEGDSSIVLPGNLYLLGTMNTADRSIALVDYALRRRFRFITLPPDRKVIEAGQGFDEPGRKAALALFDETSKVFSGASGNQDYRVGHSYFLPTSSVEAGTAKDICDRYAFEVIPLLREYEAEGVIEPGSVEALLTTLGVDIEDSLDQDSVASQILQDF